MICAALPFIVATLSSVIRSTLVGNSQLALSQSNHLFNETCQKIATSISAESGVYSVGSVNYQANIGHWASSSTQTAACSFEPGTPEDAGIALRILGQTQTPFAVKGGGHATNPGFSSTAGVQIAMSRFSEVDYDPTSQTVTIGAGLTWDTVYEKLEPHGVNVVGGRVPGVGVAGFTLGGGYSWLTNQYGLAIDTVHVFELVTPDGTVMNVTETSSPDLFFALKGGLNNFGVVTRFTFRTFPQTQVWGGLVTYTEAVLDQVNLATASFAANNTDPKASILSSYNYLLGQLLMSEIIFYDAPTPPAGVFDEFLAIPSFTQDLSTHSFSSFVRSLPVPFGTRGVLNSISVTNYSLSLLESIVNETTYWGKTLGTSVYLVSYDIEPFLPTLFSHNTTPSAYPPDRTQGILPLHFYYAWLSPEHDDAIYDAIRTSSRTLQAYATETGHSEVASAFVYPNYAIFDTPLADLYGTNLPRLQAIKKVVDPENVMGLAGGFKL